MNTVTVNTSKQYDVLIGTDLMNQLGQLVATVHKSCTVAIITDSTVSELYLNTAMDSLKNAGFSPVNFVFPAGEISKNPDTYLNILNFLAESHITRGDILIALGGGVVGDITGFAAATYLRGLPYIQVPTTLLAMVDSSVGGKTAIDLPGGKNLVGAFHQPSLVVCDVSTLNTLPREIFVDGCAEVIKYGVLYDPELFTHLANNGIDFDREYVVGRCVSLKANVVCADEFDTGLRQKLNLGHTFGHAVEKLSNFSISHGSAVAIGMQMAANAGVYLNTCGADLPQKIHDILTVFGLKNQSPFSARDMAQVSCSDKKRFGSTINLILPCHIGDCVIYPVPVAQLETIFEAGK